MHWNNNMTWQRIKTLFTNLGTIITLCIGIMIVAAGFGGALLMKPSAAGSILVSTLSSLVGGFIIARAWHRSATLPSDDNGKLEEVLAETRKVQQKNLELSRSLEKAEEALEKEKEALGKEKAEKTELQHRLDTSVNVTKIQPAMKLVTSELSFDITDFYEKPLGEEHYTRLLTRKEHKDPVFYRGVYKYAGQAELRVDLSKIKLTESADRITICGPIEYEQKIMQDENESKWLMHGRREEEAHHGQTEKEMEVYEIKVKEVRDRDLEDEHIKVLKENVKKLKLFDSIKASTDKLVVEFVKMMLAPTGKQITYNPTANEAISTRTLGEFVTDYNNRVMIPESQHILRLNDAESR